MAFPTCLTEQQTNVIKEGREKVTASPLTRQAPGMLGHLRPLCGGCQSWSPTQPFRRPAQVQNCRLLTDLILTPTVPENSGRRQGGGCVANSAGERRGCSSGPGAPAGHSSRSALHPLGLHRLLLGRGCGWSRWSLRAPRLPDCWVAPSRMGPRLRTLGPGFFFPLHTGPLCHSLHMYPWTARQKQTFFFFK